MLRIGLARIADATEWREAGRALMLAGIPPERIEWRCGGEADLFGDRPDPLPRPMADARPPRVPARFIELSQAAVCHSDPARFSTLYRLLWRLQADPRLLEFPPDADVQRLLYMEKSVRRDCHKMTAFVRFREVPGGEGSRRRFIAWFEPDHHIVERTAPFFAARFGDMDWAILTPRGSAACRAGKLVLSDAPEAPCDLHDETETLWTTYFASIFNPARLKVKAMQAEMPKKYWKNLPEARSIPALVAGARSRVAEMAEQPDRPPPAFHHRVSARASGGRPADGELTEGGGVGAGAADSSAALARLRAQAATCARCPLHCNATQTVFGEGPADARLMIVGEQPGDREDLTGRPFVGPAGRVLDEALAVAGIGRRKAWVTNAVKHFKFAPRGRMRIHRRPDSGEIVQCRWWLKQEIALVRPRLILAMGATAIEALTGRRARMAELRGRPVEIAAGIPVLATWHPSYLLRLQDGTRSAEASAQFRQDIAIAADIVGNG